MCPTNCTIKNTRQEMQRHGRKLSKSVESHYCKLTMAIHMAYCIKLRQSGADKHNHKRPKQIACQGCYFCTRKQRLNYLLECFLECKPIQAKMEVGILMPNPTFMATRSFLTFTNGIIFCLTGSKTGFSDAIIFSTC